MALQAKCLPCKPVGPSSIPGTHVKVEVGVVRTNSMTLLSAEPLSSGCGMFMLWLTRAPRPTPCTDTITINKIIVM